MYSAWMSAITPSWRISFRPVWLIVGVEWVGGTEMLVISLHGIPAVYGSVTGIETPIYHLLNLRPGLVGRLSFFHLRNEVMIPGIRISS